MKLNVIIPFYKNYDTIESLIHSIDDQDYGLEKDKNGKYSKDFCVYIIIDGKDPKARQLILDKFFKDGICTTRFKINIEEISKNSGASFARNYGEKISAQDLEAKNVNNILFFIDADCSLYPGVFSECMRQFESDKSIDFVYGNYRFDNRQNYTSMEFDPIRLQTMNYISTMSPVKRRVFNQVRGFDEIDYFQDWGLFYKLAKRGCKGKYINQYFFTTEIPTEASISGTKGLTLSDKAKVFRDFYKIDHKKLVVTSYGADYQAIQRSKMLLADYVGQNQSETRVMPPNYGFDNWKATYLVGCYSNTSGALANHLNACVGRPIIHFIGTDVFQMLNNHPMNDLVKYKETFDKLDAKLFVNSKRGQDELKLCGFDAQLLYTPIYNQSQYKWVTNPPEQFTVAVYYSDESPMMTLKESGGYSNVPLIREIARDMPDIKFKFFGGTEKYVHQDIESEVSKNIEFCGRIKPEDMTDFINSCSMIVRSCIHDGFPQLPIQFMLCGRQALVSCPDKALKYAEKISKEEIYEHFDDTKEEIFNKIYEMSENPNALKDKVQEIHDYYSELMNEETFKKEIRKCIP